MAKTYLPALLEESSRTGYTIADAVKKRVDAGWTIHSWTVLRHEFVSDGSNHGHGGRYEMVVSVLWERDS